MSTEEAAIRLIRITKEMEYLYEYTDSKRKLYFYTYVASNTEDRTLLYDISSIMKNEGLPPTMYFDLKSANVIKNNIVSFFASHDPYGKPLTSDTRSSVTFSFPFTR